VDDREVTTDLKTKWPDAFNYTEMSF